MQGCCTTSCTTDGAASYVALQVQWCMYSVVNKDVMKETHIVCWKDRLKFCVLLLHVEILCVHYLH